VRFLSLQNYLLRRRGAAGRQTPHSPSRGTIWDALTSRQGCVALPLRAASHRIPTSLPHLSGWCAGRGFWWRCAASHTPHHPRHTTPPAHTALPASATSHATSSPHTTPLTHAPPTPSPLRATFPTAAGAVPALCCDACLACLVPLPDRQTQTALLAISLLTFWFGLSICTPIHAITAARI